MPITFELATLLVTFAAAVLGMWWRIEARIREAEKAVANARESFDTDLKSVSDEVMVVAKDLGDFKLASAEKYASVEHLKDVELRLAGAVDRLTNRIELLPRQFAEQVSQILAAGSQHRR